MDSNALVVQILSLVGVLFGGGLVGHIIAGRKHTNDDKQTIINQLQEEREYLNSQLKIRDEKIDGLYDKFREWEEKYIEAHRDKVEAEWQLKKQVAENDLLEKENELLVSENKQLRIRVEDLEERVDELEKEVR